MLPAWGIAASPRRRARAVGRFAGQPD